MADLSFAVERVSPVPNAACPILRFQVQIVNRGIEHIHAIALQAQIQIEPQPQRPNRVELERLEQLFGEPSRWADAEKPLAWSSASVIVKPFAGNTRFELDAPCTFDFNIAATKYFYGLETPDAPLLFDFSGTIFRGRQIAAIKNDCRCRFALPMRVWSDLMDEYYPHSMWLRLPREVFDRMNQFKIDNRIPTWEDVLERLLPAGQEAVH